jgi:hypothetical protein
VDCKGGKTRWEKGLCAMSECQWGWRYNFRLLLPQR